MSYDSVIKANILEINKRISEAAHRSGRVREDILLLGVSKTVSADKIKIAVQNGITDLGENRVVELCEKFNERMDVNWHMIGHLQTNKVKKVVGKVTLIHSLDSYKLGVEIDKQSKAAGVISDVLVEVNIGNEQTKYGVNVEDLKETIKRVAELPNIRIYGLMCVAPIAETGEKNRNFFRKMRHLFIDINANSYDNVYMKFLSMGMSADYITAIEEGANIVRIGSGVFGLRT